MKQSLWRGKKALRQWEMFREKDGHQQRLKQVRPTSCDLEWVPPVLNPNKKLMIKEDKYTEIERQNRYLLQKITTMMNKKRERQKDRMNRSLNSSFRKKQMQTIEVENIKLLKRIQEKKSDYDASKLKKQWKKQKEVIQNIAAFPFILRTSFKSHRKRTMSRPEQSYTTATRTDTNFNALSPQVSIVRIRKIGNQNFVVTLKMDKQKLMIVGDQKKNVDNKVITIPRQEALNFIEGECDGKIEGIFDKLSYDQEQDVLYLVGNRNQLQREEQQPLTTIRQKVPTLEDDKV